MTASANVGALVIGGSGTTDSLTVEGVTLTLTSSNNISEILSGGTLSTDNAAGGPNVNINGHSLTIDAGGVLSTSGASANQSLLGDSGTLTNNGTINIGTTGGITRLYAAVMAVNNGTLSVASGATLSMDSFTTFTNAGSIASTGSTDAGNDFIDRGSISGTVTLTGGTLDDDTTAGGGNLTATGNINLTGSGTSPGIATGQVVTLDGVTATQQSATFSVAGTLSTDNTAGQPNVDINAHIMTIDAGGVLSTSGESIDQSLLGDSGTLTNNGTIDIGTTGTGISRLFSSVTTVNNGTLSVATGATLQVDSTASFTQNPSGTLAMTNDVTGGTFSLLTGGTDILGGTLDVTTNGTPTVAYVPISSASARLGEFGTLEYHGTRYETSYPASPLEVLLTPSTTLGYQSASLALSNRLIHAGGVTYTLHLQGPAIATGETLTITAPSGTTFAGTATTDVTVNGTPLSTAPTISGGGTVLTFASSVSAAANVTVTVVILDVTNAGPSGLYSLTVTDNANAASLSLGYTLSNQVTATVSGSQNFGASTPVFTFTDNTGGAVTVSGTLTCTTVNGGIPIAASLGVGSYSVDGTSCSGLTLSDSTDFTLVYAGAVNGFVVSPVTVTPVTVTVSGSQNFGASTPVFTFTDNAPSGVTVSGTLTCTTVNGGIPIAASLGVGSYSVDGTSCSGLTLSDSTDFSLVYAGATNGFVVSPVTVNVTVSGSQNFGASTPVFTFTDNTGGAVTVSGTLTCTTVNGGIPIAASLGVGSYTVDGTSCSGLTLSDSTDFSLVYAGAVNGFVVSPVTVTVTVSGSQSFGASTPVFTFTDNTGGAVTVSGTLTCTTVNGGIPIAASLGVGSYTVDGTSCSGLTLSDSTDFSLVYAGATNGFVVSPVTVTVTVSGSQSFGASTPVFTFTDNTGGAVTVSGTLTCTTVNGGIPIAASLGVGSYTVDGTSCSGLTLSDSTDFSLVYAGAVNGFVVSPVTVTPITVTVSGSQNFGASAPVFTYTDNAPSGVTVSGTLTCTTVNGGIPIAASLGVGSYTVDGTSCSGLTLSDSTDFSLVYAGATNGFVVTAATTVPGAPTLVSAAPGNGKVVLSWTAPASDGGSSITGYDILQGTSPTSLSVTATEVSGTSYTATGLTNGTAYYFEVEAVNANGASNPSNELSAVPEASNTGLVLRMFTPGLVAGHDSVYVVTVTNRGTTTTAGLLTVTDRLPSDLDPDGVFAPGWRCSTVRQTVTCTTPLRIRPRAFLALFLFVHVTARAGALITNTAHLTAVGPNPSRDTAIITTRVAAPGRCSRWLPKK